MLYNMIILYIYIYYIHKIPGILEKKHKDEVEIMQCKLSDQRQININLIVLFVILLQVFTALSAQGAS